MRCTIRPTIGPGQALHYSSAVYKSVDIHPALAPEITSIERVSGIPLYYYRCLMTEPPADYGPGMHESGCNYGDGGSFQDPATAIARSVMESWERKYSKVFDRTELIAGSYNQLCNDAVDRHWFTLISEWEYQQSPLPYVRYHADVPLSWKKCFQVCQRSLKPVLIPATLVYSRFSWKHPAQRFAPNLSSGLAAHFSFEESFLNGLCELLERDAFMLAWLHHRGSQRIREDSVPFGEAAAALDRLHSFGYDVRFLNLTTDLAIPVVMTVIAHAKLPWQGTLVMGLGCHLNPLIALEKSFREAMTILSDLVREDAGGSKLIVRVPPLPFGLHRADYFQKTRFLLGDDQEMPLDEIANHDRRDAGRNLEFLIDWLNAAGYATYFVDLTPPQFQSHRLCLTRAFIAGLQPMLAESDCWRLNPRRLFGNGPPQFEKLNLMSHPFMLPG